MRSSATSVRRSIAAWLTDGGGTNRGGNRGQTGRTLRLSAAERETLLPLIDLLFGRAASLLWSETAVQGPLQSGHKIRRSPRVVQMALKLYFQARCYQPRPKSNRRLRYDRWP